MLRLAACDAITAVSTVSQITQFGLNRLSRASVHADGLELLAPGVGDGRLAAIGQHDGGAVGRVEGIEQRARGELRRLRELWTVRAGAL